jgi:uncharacterized OB-fold protein
MPKPSPVPDEVSKSFWDACNQHRLIIQICTKCNRMQFPPEKTCLACGSSELSRREVKGRGRIHGYCVMSDSRVRLLLEQQPFNIAIIELEENPEINFFPTCQEPRPMRSR